MKTDTKQKIVEYITIHKKVKANTLIKEFKMSSAGMHKHLRELIKKGLIQRRGMSPHAVYIPAEKVNIEALFQAKKTKKFIEEQYMYISKNGEVVYGYDGLQRWLKDLIDGNSGSSSMLR